MQLHIHGARGSCPALGPAFARYGGHTTCFEIVLPDGHRLIIDGGSGLLRLQAGLAEADVREPLSATIFLTHFHWDHIQGIPFFEPLYAPDTRIHFLAAPPRGFTVQSALDAAIGPPWFPARLSEAASARKYQALAGGVVRVGPLQVTAADLHHPGGVTGYRISDSVRSVAIATDVQAGDPEGDRALRALANGADVLIHDAQYTPEEWATNRGDWGHSTWEHATALAAAAGVGRLLLTSHDPRRTDDAVDAIVADARRRFPATDGAFEGQTIEI